MSGRREAYDSPEIGPRLTLTISVPGVPERRVRAAAGDQLFVRADFVEKAFLDHSHTIGVVRGVEPMRDCNHGSPVEHAS